MAKLTLIAVLVLAVVQASLSFTFSGTPNFVGVSQRVSHTQLFGLGDGDKEGGAAIAKPKIGQKTAVEVTTRQKVEIRKAAKPAEPVQRRDDDFQDAPMYKLMLVGDEGYDPTHVVERMCAIVDDMDEDQAATVFQQANSMGKAMCGKYPYERAELFKEQLQRSDPMIFADMEEENA